MKSELSSLLDDELEGERQQALLSALRSDAELRSTWSEYHLIGDALRRTPQLNVDLTARVMAGLQREPAILVPQARVSAAERAARARQGAMRYVAAVAGVGVVGWLALSGPQTATQNAPQRMARVAAAVPLAEVPHAVPTAQALQAGNASRMQAYLVAHQAYSPSNRFDGGAGYVRTVAATR